MSLSHSRGKESRPSPVAVLFSVLNGYQRLQRAFTSLFLYGYKTLLPFFKKAERKERPFFAIQTLPRQDSKEYGTFSKRTFEIASQKRKGSASYSPKRSSVRPFLSAMPRGLSGERTNPFRRSIYICWRYPCRTEPRGNPRREMW